MAAPTYPPGAAVTVASGSCRGRTGSIQQPPGKTWPDALGRIGVLLDKAGSKPAEAKLFTPSQLVFA